MTELGAWSPGRKEVIMGSSLEEEEVEEEELGGCRSVIELTDI